MNVNRKKIIWFVVLGIVGISPFAYFIGGATKCYLNKRALVRTIRDADRVVVYNTTNPHNKKEYRGNDLQLIIKAIAESRSDNRLYDTPVGLYCMEFYKDNKLLAQIGACSDLWRYRSKQYRVPYGSRFSEYLMI